MSYTTTQNRFRLPVGLPLWSGCLHVTLFVCSSLFVSFSCLRVCLFVFRPGCILVSVWAWLMPLCLPVYLHLTVFLRVCVCIYISVWMCKLLVLLCFVSSVLSAWKTFWRFNLHFAFKNSFASSQSLNAETVNVYTLSSLVGLPTFVCHKRAVGKKSTHNIHVFVVDLRNLWTTVQQGSHYQQ